MVQLQPVLGFFDTRAEAQQAVQLLLARGFTSEHVDLSTQPSPSTSGAGGNLPALTESDRSSGRFSSALFDRRVEGRSQTGILVRVQIRSATEAQQVAHLLETAGAVDERMNSEPDFVRNDVIG